MRFRRLQNYVGMIMVSSALVLSTIFSVLAYTLNQHLAEQESQRQVQSLMATVKNTASAALFSANEAVGWDAINGLLGNAVVYSAQLEGYADEFSSGLKIAGIHKEGGEAMALVSMELESIFDQGHILGRLSVESNKKWVDQRTRDTSVPIILGVIFVISFSFFVSGHALKLRVSEPLVQVRRRLRHIHADSRERLQLPDHLKPNEIGALVDGFNELLDETNAAFEIERRLRKQMELVQNNLELAKAEAESAAQAKSDFLATMSHEIRTPLSGVLGMLGFALKDASIHEKTKEQLEIAHSNARALLTIINDILDLSKMEAGKLNVETVDFAIRSEVKAAVAVFADMAKDKSLDFHLNIHEDVPKYVRADPTRIRQVLVNLIGNAIKFTSEGSVEVSIEIVEAQGENCRLRFLVQDSGIGIPAEAISKLFQKFEQADVSTTRKYGGTGLGLSICKQLVELMNGEIGVSSEVGEGATFFFELPMAIGSAEACEQDSGEQVPHTHKLHLLCAEDFVTNQVIIRTLLEEMGHEVEIADNGAVALDMLVRTEFDLVLMDGRMPEMDGLEATRCLRSGQWQGERIQQRDIKVVALTANVTDEDRERYLAAGMNDFLCKPVDEAELHRMLEETIIELLDEGKKLYPLIRASAAELDSLFSVPLDNSSTKLANSVAFESYSEQESPTRDSDLSSKLRATFIASLPERIDEINHAMATENYDELGRLFHGMKGSAAYLNDDVLVVSAETLENLADEHSMDELSEHLEQFMALLTTYSLDSINSTNTL